MPAAAKNPPAGCFANEAGRGGRAKREGHQRCPAPEENAGGIPQTCAEGQAEADCATAKSVVELCGS